MSLLQYLNTCVANSTSTCVIFEEAEKTRKLEISCLEHKHYKSRLYLVQNNLRKDEEVLCSATSLK